MDNYLILMICILNLVFMICGYLIGSHKKIITIKSTDVLEYNSEPQPLGSAPEYQDEEAYTVEGKDIEYVRVRLD